MAFPYKKILILGSTSGIGLTLAERLIAHGCFVIGAGRRKENLDAFVQKHGEGKAARVEVDIGELEAIPQFVADVIKSHPDLDCVFINSGIQRRSVFSEPESINMEMITEEFAINYLSYLYLTKEFLPFFQAKKDTPTAFIFTSSGLAFAPILRCSNYCATKAALHHWTLALREQLKETSTRVIEIFPPLVQTELHDAKHQPDITGGGGMGLPVEEFADETMRKLLAGDDQIPVGTANIAFNSWEQQRQQQFHKTVEMMKGSGL
ncbi:putative NADP(+)-dependent dehydrogenase [Aspergillus clavatus NRRL 1]|uniref:NADP(+)-dependent dehydrogenase, putative n=1 Tax=Aspergillus clavatus (strain ATCC 1007 / CBS 513.65 / DSM 816 / NCTC 3887 / NRRL 1 / QM 1276 / 107) TaxID=344612 RepID=A1CBV8_ASPCL|nr:NADP(+)-dependent dehydrogenase, putative [Aspergillus clavatus NRRL 1]EAW13226.1 NADP(+)-dependent dehydrogenase, putative [Aspergillus clavatus NRRL 1]